MSDGSVPGPGLPFQSLGSRMTPDEKVRGCVGLLGGAWLVWVLVDLGRAGVFSGETSFLDAFFRSPSLFYPTILVLIGLPSIVRTLLRERRKRRFPDEPWMWDRRWNRGGAFDQRSVLAMPSLFAAFVATAFVAVAATISGVVDGSDWPASSRLVLALILSVPLLVTWVPAGRRWAPVLKFGRSFVRYRTFPFFLGERLAGTLEGIDRLRGFTTMAVTLRCVLEKTVGSGKSARVVRETLHEERRDVAPEEVTFGKGRAAGLFKLVRRADEEASLPLSFRLPDQRVLASDLHGSPKRLWELTVTAEVPGLDYEATFLLPVYPRPEPDGGDRAPE